VTEARGNARGAGRGAGRRRHLRGHPEETIFLFLALATIALLLILGRGMTFFADEWAIIERREISLEDWLRPFNEHWLGTTIVAYRLMLGAVGLSSYLPYLGFVAVLHAIVAAEVLVLVRRSSGPLVGLAASTVVLLFGSGFENLYWGAQIGFVGATAMGLGALILLEPRADAVRPSGGRVVSAVALLTLAMTTSGFGIFMLGAVGLEVLADRRRWPLVLPLAIPAAVYLAWFLTLGRSGVGFARDPFTAEAFADVPRFIAEGLGDAAGSVVGVGPSIGLFVVALVTIVVVVRSVRGRPPGARFLGSVGGIVVMYAILGLVRGGVLETAALYPRYSYLSGILFAIALGALVGRPRLPSRAAGRAAGRVALGAIGGSLLVMALVWNGRLLIVGRDIFLDRADLTRALIAVALDPELPAIVDRDRDLILVPSPNSLERIVQAHGSPLQDALVEPLPAIPEEVLDEARQRVLGDAAATYPRIGRPARP